MSTSCPVAVAHTLPDKPKFKPHKALFLPKALLGVLLAFPLGIASALADAVPVFTSILPISVLCALVCLIIVPLITASSVLFVTWFGTRAIARTLIRTGISIAALITADSRAARALHMLLHTHEVAYMGLYGTFILSGIIKNSQPHVPPKPLYRRPRARLFIPIFPKSTGPTFPLTPPSSDPSYTPTRSPTLTECTDASIPIPTPVDEPMHSSLARLSSLLHTLEDDQLDVVASYVEILKKRQDSLRMKDPLCYGA